MMAIEGIYVSFKRTAFKQKSTVISNNIFIFLKFLTAFYHILAPYFEIKHAHKLKLGTHVEICIKFTLSIKYFKDLRPLNHFCGRGA